MRLTTKFNLVLFIVFSIGLAIAGYISYSVLQKHAREEVLAHAGMMMEAAIPPGPRTRPAHRAV